MHSDYFSASRGPGNYEVTVERYGGFLPLANGELYLIPIRFIESRCLREAIRRRPDATAAAFEPDAANAPESPKKSAPSSCGVEGNNI